MSRNVPILVALTGEARRALYGATELELTHFPFRLGRDSGSPVHTGIFTRADRQAQAGPPVNDLYIWDPGPLLNVSRQHFQIERTGEGGFIVRDRGSTCGTWVGNVRLGAGGQETCALYPDNTIVVGTATSPFVFRFDIREETRVARDNTSESTSARRKAQSAWKMKQP